MKNLNLTFLLFILCINSFAQNKDTTYSFSIKEAIDFALQNQKDVVNAGLDAEISDYKVKETVGIGLPQISGNVDVKDYLKIPTQFVSDFISPAIYNVLYDENLISEKKEPSSDLYPIQFGAKWNATAGVTASQLIFDPSYLVGVKAAKTFRELSQKNLTRTRIETAITVTKAYYLVLLLRERKKVIDANDTRLKKLLKDTKALYENGFVEKIDLDRIQVANNNIETESKNFERLIENSENTLKFQIGLPYGAILTVKDSLNIEAVKNIKTNVDEINPENRIEYSILKTTERLQEYNLKRYKKQYYPTLFAYGSLNTSAQRTDFDVFEFGHPWYPTALIGATLNINLFDGRQREMRIKQESLALKKINNEVLNFENLIELDVSTNHATLLVALSALDIQIKNMDLANSVTRTAKIKYDQGVGSNLEILDAEASLKESQVNYFNALYNAILAKIELEKALGNIKY